MNYYNQPTDTESLTLEEARGGFSVAGGGCRGGRFAGEAANMAELAGGRLVEIAKIDVFKAEIVLNMKFSRWLFGGSAMAF
ncbi:MAG: hypothetical protein IPL32_06500 [Chloracidobacterium sp.]|nr:hypothetical protein [Chloracidobacterium sp.]